MITAFRDTTTWTFSKYEQHRHKKTRKSICPCHVPPFGTFGQPADSVCNMQIWVGHVKRQGNLYVAMKVPVDALEREHINSEGRIVTQFNHPNIVKGLGWLRFPGTAPRGIDALVLEYCPLGNLWERIEQKQTPGRENKFNNCMDDHQRCAQFPFRAGADS
jgi:serine/threonine protein kinase